MTHDRFGDVMVLFHEARRNPAEFNEGEVIELLNAIRNLSKFERRVNGPLSDEQEEALQQLWNAAEWIVDVDGLSSNESEQLYECVKVCGELELLNNIPSQSRLTREDVKDELRYLSGGIRAAFAAGEER